MTTLIQPPLTDAELADMAALGLGAPSPFVEFANVVKLYRQSVKMRPFVEWAADPKRQLSWKDEYQSYNCLACWGSGWTPDEIRHEPNCLHLLAKELLKP